MDTEKTAQELPQLLPDHISLLQHIVDVELTYLKRCVPSLELQIKTLEEISNTLLLIRNHYEPSRCAVVAPPPILTAQAN